MKQQMIQPNTLKILALAPQKPFFVSKLIFRKIFALTLQKPFFISKLIFSGHSVYQIAFILAHKRWVKDRGDETFRLNYDLSESSLVVDLGGYMGDFADNIHKKYGCKVLVFEPNPNFFEKCKERFQKNPKVQVFNYGIADVNDDLFLSDKADGSSFLTYTLDENKTGTLCKVRRYSDIIKELEINEIDLMKINIEGAEYPLMEHIIQQNLVSVVKNFQIQFHHLQNKPLRSRYKKISAKLSETYTQTWRYWSVWENWERK